MGMLIFIGGFLVVCAIHAGVVNKDFKSEKKQERKEAKARNAGEDVEAGEKNYLDLVDEGDSVTVNVKTENGEERFSGKVAKERGRDARRNRNSGGTETNTSDSL